MNSRRIKVKLPKLGLTVESGRLVEWSKRVGEAVQAGEVIGQIEVDKAVQDLEAPVSGILVELLVPADPESEYAVGTELAVIET